MKTWKKVTIVIFLILLVVGTLFYQRLRAIEKDIKVEYQIHDYYLLGYEAGYDDYAYGNDYGHTLCNRYDKLLYYLRLAYDAGYGYGYYDNAVENGRMNEERGHEYRVDYSPDWMWNLYCLFR